MAQFVITAPDGKKFIVSGANQAGAAKAFQDFLAKGGEQQLAAPQQQAAQPQQPATGTPMQRDTGLFGLPLMTKGVDAGYQDPDVGEHIMGGINAFGTKTAESVPIVGPWLRDLGNNVDAGFASMVEGKPVTPEERQAINEQDQAANPAASIAGTLTGSVGPLLGLGAIPGVSRALGMSGGLASRMGLGSLSGVGIGAGDTAMRGGTPEEIAKSALIGGIAGIGLPLLGAGAGKVVSTLTGKSVPKEIANLGQAMKHDQINPADLNTRIAQMGQDAMVMDQGPNLQRLAGAIASVPGEGQKVLRQAITDRGAKATQRVTGDVAATVGASPDIDQLTTQIISTQKAAADPLYTAVRPVAIKPTGNIQFVFQTPMGKKALAEAQELAKNDGVVLPMSGQGPLMNGWTVGLIDYTKRALDDIQAAALRVGHDNVARQARDLANILKREADAQVPGYKAARDAFAGPAAVLDAIEAGKTAFSKDMSPKQLQSAMAAMSAGEKDAYLQAARSQIEAVMGNAVNDALSLRNLFKKGWNEEKLRVLLGNQITDDLMSRISREAAFGQTHGVVAAGPETAARLAGQEMVAPELRKAGPVSLLQLVFGAFNAARAGIRGQLQPKVNKGMADLLSSGNIDPATLAKLTQAVKGRGKSLLPAAGVSVGAQQEQQMPQITVHGGKVVPLEELMRSLGM